MREEINRIRRRFLSMAVVAVAAVRLGVSVATSGDVRDQPKVADAASELLQDVFGEEKSPRRLVYGVTSLPLGPPVELDIIFEVPEQLEPSDESFKFARLDSRR